MSIISTETTVAGVTLEVPRHSTEMVIRIGESSVTLKKWQARLLADYLAEEIGNLVD